MCCVVLCCVVLGWVVLLFERPQTDLDAFRAREFSVVRRFSDFVWVRQQLSQHHKGYIIPPLPEKRLMGRLDPDVVAARQRQLERFLTRVARHPALNLDGELVCWCVGVCWCVRLVCVVGVCGLCGVCFAVREAHSLYWCGGAVRHRALVASGVVTRVRGWGCAHQPRLWRSCKRVKRALRS